MHAEDVLPRSEDKPIIERSTLSDAPGALRGQVWLAIQTRQAQQLIRGRDGTPDKPTIIGLVGFADRLRVIWQAARNDDPYADWWLIKVHEAIDAARTYIRNRQTDLNDQLNEMPAMEVSVATSQRPYRVPLQFANPYAYRGAHLLSEYDRLVCLALTARHMGLLDGETCTRLLNVCARKIRSTFTTPQSYRFLKLDRESVRKATGRSHEASKAMGEVPDDVLSGERQAPLVPRKVKFPTAFTGHVDLHPESPESNTNLSEDKNDDG